MTDAIAPVVVRDHDGIRVVRDDLHGGGTKARYLARLYAGGAEEVVYASPAQGGAQCALAYVAATLGKRATIFVARRKARHARTQEAAAMGATIVESDNGRLNVVQARARAYCAETGARLAPFGMEIEGAEDIIAQIARATGEDPDEVWCASGSGLLARGLHKAWPRAALHHVIVGGRNTSIEGTTAHVYPQPFDFRAEAPPFPADRHYEAKAWEVCAREHGPGRVLFWNVTGETMAPPRETMAPPPGKAVTPTQVNLPPAGASVAATLIIPQSAENMAPAEGYRVEFRLLSSLVPYERNARTHSKDQINTIDRLIMEYGWTNPMLVDDRIRAGHGRRLAAQQIYARGEVIRLPSGLEIPRGHVPVIDCSGWTPAQKRAYVLADNQSALLAGWDSSVAHAEIFELKAANFDLSLTAFGPRDVLRFAEAAQGDPTDPTMRKLEGDDRVRMNAAWRSLMEDWAGFMGSYDELGYLSTNFTKGGLAVYFVRAQLFGTNIPRAATTPYTGHRFFVAGSKLPISSAFEAAMKEDGLLESMIWQCQNRPAFDKMFGSLGIHGHRAPADFPATLAASLMDEFLPRRGGAVLDPCHGWGGRMVGFLLSKKATSYRGFDVDRRTQEGVQRIFNDLRPLAIGDKATELTLCPFEDARLASRTFDFALTSPPYFNVEKYDGDDQSWRRYPTFEEWVAGFYDPLITSVADALRPGCAFALQIGNQSFPLEKTARAIADTCGLAYVETRATNMVNNYTETEAEDGEVVVIFRRGK